MPRILWIPTAAGFLLGALLASAFGLASYDELEKAELGGNGKGFLGQSVWVGFALWVLAGGFLGGLFGFGVGSIIYAPRWAGIGVILACVPNALMFLPVLFITGDTKMYLQALLATTPLLAACGGGLGALVKLYRDQNRKMNANLPS
ncbi:MAG TPA: hypothetical protein VE988_11330 [Gemmataceae bacterium]|nr:hypothetical protein [Gemmataceae bacterium]